MQKKLIGILMGSDSDWKIMQEAAKFLDEAKVPYEVLVASAHRTPEKVAAYAKAAEEQGIQILIVGAGKAAHLPGVVAAYTVLPVIGVPIQTPDLGGIDSLYSIVQMPSGIPVATVAINGAKNAAILALEILALQSPELKNFLKEYRERMAQEVENKNAALQQSLK